MGKFKNNVQAIKCCLTNGKFALLLFISIFLLSCNSKSPSESTAKKLLQEKIKTQSENKILLKDFDKLGGREEKNYMGEFYVMKYKATIEFTQDINKGYSFGQSEFSNFYVGGGFGLSNFHSANSQSTFQEEMYLRKTENGWEEVKMLAP